MGKFTPPAPQLPPPAPAIPEKKTDPAVKAKADAARVAAVGRQGFGSTINTSGTGAPAQAPTSRASLLGSS